MERGPNQWKVQGAAAVELEASAGLVADEEETDRWGRGMLSGTAKVGTKRDANEQTDGTRRAS